jgi:hypothetical protein
MHLFKRYPLNTLYGTGGLSGLDIAQSQFLGDCYFIAGVVAFAERTLGFDNLFVTKEVNPSGICCFNIYVRGIRKIACVDDLLPFLMVNG